MRWRRQKVNDVNSKYWDLHPGPELQIPGEEKGASPLRTRGFLCAVLQQIPVYCCTTHAHMELLQILPRLLPQEGWSSWRMMHRDTKKQENNTRKRWSIRDRMYKLSKYAQNQFNSRYRAYSCPTAPARTLPPTSYHGWFLDLQMLQ